MKKRPLCAAALLAMLLLLALPADIWMEDDFPDTGRGQPEAVKGEVESCEPTSSGGQAVYLSHSNVSQTSLVLVYLKAETSYSVGNLIQTTGKLKIKKLDIPTNPGQFDARLYFQTKGVTLTAYADDAELLDGQVRPFGDWLQRIRRKLGERCTRLLGEYQGGVFRAMALGDKTELEPELKALYQQSGMSHLLAISGLHISIFGMGFYRLLRRLGFSYPMAGLSSMGFLLLYGLMTGMSTSTVRAVIMFLLAVGADLLGRSYDLLTALACAALLLLTEQPLYAKSASFLLSFGAVMGIGVVYPALLSLFPVKRRKSQAFLLSLSVQSVTLPLSLYFFYEFPLYGIFINLLAIPLMTALLFLGVGAVLLSFLSLTAAQVPAFLCTLILKIYEGLGGFSLYQPGAVQICGRPKGWQLLFYGAGLIGLLVWQYNGIERERWNRTKAALSEKKEERESEESGKRGGLQRQLICGGVYGILLLLLLLQFPHRGLTFTMLDVGQGDALFLRTGSGTTYLIDGGSSSVSSVGAYRILPFLKEQGVRTLDCLAVTHLDQDHISGVLEILEAAGEPGGIRIETLLLTEQEAGEEAKELLALAARCKARVYHMKEGDMIVDGGTQITCLHPGSGKTYSDKNTASLVLGVEYQNFSLILTGDLDEEGEKEILRAWKQTDGFDVLKVGHHGSGSSTSEAWLMAVKPKLALISAGENNRYGHPSPETLERLREADSEILQTTECGAITIRTDGEVIAVEKFCEQKTHH